MQGFSFKNVQFKMKNRYFFIVKIKHQSEFSYYFISILLTKKLSNKNTIMCFKSIIASPAIWVLNI